jgi:hypothetical protein
MINKIIPITGTIFFLLFSCSKNESISPNYYSGTAYALKNGEKWVTKVAMKQNKFTNENSYNLLFDYFNNQGIIRQRLALYKIPNNIAIHALFDTSPNLDDGLVGAQFFTHADDGDVLEDIYLVVEDSIWSCAEITSIHTNSSTYSGSFKVKLYIDPNRPKINPNNPDTIILEKGLFEVKLQE